MNPTLWGIAALALAAAFVLAAPLLTRRRSADPMDWERAAFEAQRAEIERDLGLGVIDRETAEAAGREVERRFLRRAETLERDQGARPGPRAGGKFLACALAILAPLGAVALYLDLGRPALEAQPLALREPPPATAIAGVDASEFDDALASLEARLAAEPEDGVGWLMLGRAQRLAGDLARSARAYERAQALFPDDPTIALETAEALFLEAEGAMTPRAEALFRAAARADPNAPAPRFYLALARAQAGDPAGARDAIRALYVESVATPGVLMRLRAGFVQLTHELGLDVGAELAELDQQREARMATAAPARPGPDAAAMAAAQVMNPEERDAMIRSMVDGLAQRLEEEPEDLEGWRRLAQARGVLGEYDLAAAALDEVLARAPDDLDALKARARLALETPDAEPSQGPPIVGDEAAALYARALAVEPNDPEALWHAGLRALQEEDEEGALRHWRALEQGMPPSDPRRAALARELEAIEARVLDAE